MLANIQFRTFCLHIFCPETYRLKFYNFSWGFVWVLNLVSDFKGGRQREGIWEQGAEENIWTEEG
jgi:hypothetical protein